MHGMMAGSLAGASVSTAVPLDLSDPRFDDLEEEEVRREGNKRNGAGEV